MRNERRAANGVDCLKNMQKKFDSAKTRRSVFLGCKIFSARELHSSATGVSRCQEMTCGKMRKNGIMLPFIA